MLTKTDQLQSLVLHPIVLGGGGGGGGGGGDNPGLGFHYWRSSWRANLLRQAALRLSWVRCALWLSVSTSSTDEVLSGISLMGICPGSFLGTRDCLFQCTIWLSAWTMYDLSDSCSRHVPGYILAYFSLGKLLLCFLSFPAYAAFHTFHYCEMQETCGCGQQGPDSAWHQPLCWACSNAFCWCVSVVQQVLCSGIRTNQLLLCSGVCLECVDSAYKLLWVLCS